MKTAHDLVAAAKAEIQEVAVESAEQAVKIADFLIDVREPNEFHTGHIPGAINIPRGLLEFTLSGDPSLENRELKIVLYCKTSGRASLAAVALKQMGYVNVQSIDGGFEAWQSAGKDVARPTELHFE